MRGSLTSILGHLRRVVARRCAGGLSDVELLQRFTAQRDEAAFEVLVWRHGPMVLNVAHRVLQNRDDAEDVLQATFLVLVRRAASVRRGGALAGWLYQVAYRTALRARDQRAKCPAGPVAVDEVPAPPPSGDDLGLDVLAVLDEELQRLPDKYRTPLVLSYLQGLTNREIADQLGCPPGTVFTRLARGRDLLRKRLTRRGVTLSAGLLSTALAAGAATPALRAGVVQATVKAALVFAAGSGSAAGALAPNVVALAEGVLKMTGPSRQRIVVAALVLLIVAGSGAGLLALRGADQEKGNAPPRPAEADKPAETRRPPKEALRYGGKDFDEWRSVLRTDLKPETRVEAIKALCAFGANGYGREAAAAVVEALRGYDIGAVDQDDFKVVDAAALGLAKIGAEAGPALLDELKTGGKTGRWFALLALARLNKVAKAVVPAVTEAIKDEDPVIRLGALDALNSVDPEGTSVGAVAAAVTDEAVEVRLRALNLLAWWGPKARAATPQLLATAVKDDNAGCRQQALEALRAVKPTAKALVPTLAEAVKDKELRVRLKAIDLLAELGPEAKEAVPALVGDFQRSEDSNERLKIIRVLQGMGAAAKAAVPALTEFLGRDGSRSPLSDEVMRALSKINQ
jgi:RNA polymerase sigma factor (sigma-70 family)